MGVTHTFVSGIADDPAAAAAGQVLPSHWNATHTVNVNLASEVSGVLPVANGGSGTGTPSLVAGSNTAVSGTWPNQTIGFSGVLPVVNGGSGTATPSLVAGTNITVSGTWPNQTIDAAGGSPGGSTTQLQYNNAGAFGGASGLTTNGTELTIASGTKTADAPLLNATQTWNNAAITFTGLKFNATDTASNAASLLMDLQVGGTSLFSVNKSGDIQLWSNPRNITWGNISGVATLNFAGNRGNTPVMRLGGATNGIELANTSIGWANNSAYTTIDLTLYRDAADTLAQRRSTNAQTFRVYKSYTDASNYSRLAINNNQIASEVLGTGSLAITADTPLLNLAQTWNNAAVTFTGAKINVTDTASNAASLLLDLQVGGTSKFKINKSGTAQASSGSATDTSFALNQANTGIYSRSAGFFNISANGAVRVDISSTDIVFGSGFQLTDNTALTGNIARLSVKATASLQFGSVDSVAPIAQTIGPQSVVVGTSNTAGQNFTIRGSQGTGTGVGGDIIFQVAPAGSSGTAQNTLVQAMRIYNNKTVAVGSAYTVATLPAAGTQGRRAWVTDATAPTFLGVLIGGGTVVCPVFDDGTAWVAG